LAGYYVRIVKSVQAVPALLLSHLLGVSKSFFKTVTVLDNFGSQACCTVDFGLWSISRNHGVGLEPQAPGSPGHALGVVASRRCYYRSKVPFFDLDTEGIKSTAYFVGTGGLKVL
jgi:hypothetical protein